MFVQNQILGHFLTISQLLMLSSFMREILTKMICQNGDHHINYLSISTWRLLFMLLFEVK